MASYGRRVIYTALDRVDGGNVVAVLTNALGSHNANRVEINNLYDYYRGKHASILARQKDVRPEICARTSVGVPNEIVNFKTGYLVGEPIQYIAAVADERISAEIAALNSSMASIAKSAKDKEVVEWGMIAGTAYRMCLPAADTDDIDSAGVPYEIHTLDPRNAFVVYSSRIGNKPMCGVYIGKDEEDNTVYSVYTDTEYFEIGGEGEQSVIKRGVNPLGIIPIIEYPANTARLGAFEIVLDLCDALDEITSLRQDGLNQFVQSLCVATNCNFEEDVTANSIMQAGMICLHSTDDNRADFKILTEQLDQTQNQTLKNDIYSSILAICGMPSQGDGTTSDSSNNGAVILRNGWQSAEARAKDSELMFKASEKRFLKVVLRIMRDTVGTDITLRDIAVKFTRRHYEDILTKAEVLTMMLGNEKIAPQYAFTHCGMFTDAEEAYRESMAYYEENKANEAGSGEAVSAQD